MKEILSAFSKYTSNFFNSSPAFACAIAALIAEGTALWHSSLFVLIFPIFFLPRKKICLLATLITFFYFNALTMLSPPHIPEGGLLGEGIFIPQHLSSSSASSLHVKGVLKTFTSAPEKIEGLPISLLIKKDMMPPANQHWTIKGILKQTPRGFFYLKLINKKSTSPVVHTWAPAKFRYQLKEMIRKKVSSFFSNEEVRKFLSALITGDEQDKLLSFELERFSLQHVMAISGFHFACLAAFLSVLLQRLPFKKWALFLTLITLSSYFLLLGQQPSIMRAWLSISLAFIATLFKRHPCPLNSLGIGLLIVLALDPSSLFLLGFQFSFASVLSILLFYPYIEEKLSLFSPKRSLSEALALSYFEQHIYCFLTFAKKAFSLTLSVSLATVPLSLFYFQKFPIFSFFYNLFFPPLVGVSLSLLLLGGLVGAIIPLLGTGIHALNEALTSFAIHTLIAFPTRFDFWVTSPPFSEKMILLYFILLFALGIFLHVKKKEESAKNWLFYL